MAYKKDPNLAKSMGLVIRELRKKKYPGHGGQTRCAKEMSVTQSEWSRWESGVKMPSAVNQRRLAEFFGVNIGELWGMTEPVAVQQDSHPVIDETTGRLEPSVVLSLYRIGHEIQRKVGDLLDRVEAQPQELEQALSVLRFVEYSLSTAGSGVDGGSGGDLPPSSLV